MCTLIAVSDQMPRKPLIRSQEHPYHVTARGNNREKFPIDLNLMWQILSEECYLISILFHVKIHALVMMPNHFHMLLTVPLADLGEVMNQFMSDISRTVNRISGRSGRIFGAPYHWTLITSAQYYSYALRYVYRNPVRANLASHAEIYPWSTLHGIFGHGHCLVPISRSFWELPQLSNEDPWILLDWINQPSDALSDPVIQKELKKRIFGSPSDRYQLQTIQNSKQNNSVNF